MQNPFNQAQRMSKLKENVKSFCGYYTWNILKEMKYFEFYICFANHLDILKNLTFTLYRPRMRRSLNYQFVGFLVNIHTSE